MEVPSINLTAHRKHFRGILAGMVRSREEHEKTIEKKGEKWDKQ